MRKSSARVCIVTPEYPPDQWGGLARTVRNVGFHVRDMGHETHVAHFTVESSLPVLLDENRESMQRDGITIHRVRVGRERTQDSNRDLWDCPHTLTIQMMYQSLEMLHRMIGFDLYVSFFLYPVGYVAGLIARRMRVPTVAVVVGNDVKKYMFSPEKVAVCRSGLENADRIVALSRDLVEMAHSLSPIEEKAAVIYNSVEIPEPVWKKSRDPRTPFRIGCAGIFKYAKGLPYLFKATAQIRNLRPVVLEIVGTVRESEEQTYDYMVTGTGIDDVIVRKPPLEHDEIPDWLRSLDVFVLPSVTEGCPNILMEAMAVGVPAVATRTGAVPDLIEHGTSGLVVPWGDSGALADALRQIMVDEDLARSLGAAGRARMQRFSFQAEGREWELLLRDILHKW
ncbi:MAG: glycosyltransferase [Desulfomonilaceae bacterium]|nr:glycosyltransferase [Desulfomonilaceae bacterium]